MVDNSWHGHQSCQGQGDPGRTRSGRRKHWKLPDMIQGVRHRFRDKMRSKSPDCSLDDASSQHSMYKYNGPENNGGATLPRASSMVSTDYGFSEWGEPIPPVMRGGYRIVGQMPNNRTLDGTAQYVPRPSQLGTVPSSGPGPGVITNGNGMAGLRNRSPGLAMAKAGGSTNSYRSFEFHGAYNDSGVVYRPDRPATADGVQFTPSIGRAASSNVLNHTGAAYNTAVPIQRGKSVRFGENRISVFMQDTTQALEECVRLALSYAEETKRGEYCSDSEAVALSRRISQECEPTSRQDNIKPFYSDTEERVTKKTEMTDGSLVYGNFVDRGPPTPMTYKPTRPMGQAVNSLDRVERVDKYRRRKKHSSNMREVFSLVDKVLSGCDNVKGCNDEACPTRRAEKAKRILEGRVEWGTNQSR